MKTTNTLLRWGVMLLAAMATTLFTSCETDDDEKLSDEEVEAALAILEGDLVVSSHVTVGGTDKTLLESGAPAKFTIERAGGNRFNMWQDGFQLGKMPFPIGVGISVELVPVLSLESDDLKGNGWVRFYGKRGTISTDGSRPESAVDTNASGDGTTITGYLNVSTKEIQFRISYAMMTVELSAPRQIVDPSRAENFEQEKEEYEAELEKYKKEHGLE